MFPPVGHELNDDTFTINPVPLIPFVPFSPFVPFTPFVPFIPLVPLVIPIAEIRHEAFTPAVPLVEMFPPVRQAVELKLIHDVPPAAAEHCEVLSGNCIHRVFVIIKL